MRLIRSIAILLAVLVLAPATAVLAHSPVFPEENHSPSTAYKISDPDKSWAIYTALEHEGVDYYRFTRVSGEKIQISLIVPESPSDSGFLPSLALLGPGLIPDEHVNDHSSPICPSPCLFTENSILSSAIMPLKLLNGSLVAIIPATCQQPGSPG